MIQKPDFVEIGFLVTRAMHFARDFFALNWRFATKVAEVARIPFADALLNYTHLYLRFNFGRGFDPQHPVWQDYLRGLDQAQDLAEWTYQTYLMQMPPGGATQPADDRTFGCFSYGLWSDGRIRLHFHNGDPPEFGPLSKARMPDRLRDLRQLFVHVQSRVENPVSVVGGSWLYNIDAYRRLFHQRFSLLHTWAATTGSFWPCGASSWIDTATASVT